MAKHTPILTHREAVSRPFPDGKESWTVVKSPLKYIGLYLRVSKSGGRAYYYRFGMAGKQRKVWLGDTSDTYLEDAAEQHAQLVKQVKAGTDIVAERQIAAKELRQKAEAPTGFTVRQLCERWLHDYLWKNTKPYTAKTVENRVYRHVIKRWRTPQHVIQLRDDLIKAGIGATSNTIVGTLKQIYSFGVEELLVKSNPAREIKRRAKTVHREIAWTDEQIREIWLALSTSNTINKPAELAIKLLFLTGCRRCEITNLEQSEVTLDDKTGTGVITLPAERVKTDKQHYVYLPPLAAGIVKQAMEISTSERYVFGNPLTHRQGHPVTAGTVTRTFTTLLKKLGIPGVLHTTRHTCMTGCLKLGIEYSVVESLLNHAPAGSGAIYAKAHSYPRQQKAWTQWSEHVQAVVDGSAMASGENVLQMFNRKAS
jgi:integrase